ncbi:hypothetical protein MA16_Dca007005 [Dendrobium catenatum]|uniref:Uncharacterized protein n=1 Tax=Dendrobium catenatum TaxID=906689 RepID=A0A2I0VX33_9ASPA|nr:hypothetical protein MA16_Dca007005 [Dendrobium catenatum]
MSLTVTVNKNSEQKVPERHGLKARWTQANPEGLEGYLVAQRPSKGNQATASFIIWWAGLMRGAVSIALAFNLANMSSSAWRNGGESQVDPGLLEGLIKSRSFRTHGNTSDSTTIRSTYKNVLNYFNKSTREVSSI